MSIFFSIYVNNNRAGCITRTPEEQTTRQLYGSFCNDDVRMCRGI